MKLLVASHNKGKINEFKEILKNTEFEVISLADLNDTDEVEETGLTFYENAYIKANYYFQKYNLPVISDDSGLVVKVLNNQPGVYSSRYSGKGDYENNLKLLSNLNKETERKAHFECVLVYINEHGDVHSFKGRLYGAIHYEMKGVQGFGYDPIFYLKRYNKTLAELGSLKNRISHRSKALAKFKRYIYENTYNKWCSW